MIGSFKADFAGTKVEAEKFCEEHGFKLAKKNFTSGDEGLPMISKGYANMVEREQVLVDFMKVEFDREHLIEKRYK